MVTKLIGVREFRQNIASYYRKSIKNDWRFLIMNRNQPIFEVRPISRKNATLEKLYADIAKAREDYKQGRVYSLDEVCRRLGI
jgi:hypothetical protein